MFCILTAFLFFLVSVGIHIILCRRTREGVLIKSFAVVAGVNLLLCWLVWGLMASWPGNAADVHGTLMNVPLPLTATALYVFAIPAYVIFYVSTRLNSPSRTVLTLIQDKGPISYDELLKQMTADAFVRPRLQDLLDTQCAVQGPDGRYRLTATGLRAAWIVQIYEFLLGREAGG